MTGHDEHEKNNSKYLDNNDDLLCPVTYCAPVSPMPKFESSRLNGVAVIAKTHIHTHIHTYIHPAELR